MTAKYVCTNSSCRWHGEDTEILTAPDPFNEGCTLQACPECREQSLTAGCDEPQCRDEATCGTPTPDRYRVTCSRHRPKGDKE